MNNKNRKKILVVFGTRPEAIKMAPLIIKLKERLEFETKVCITSQHRKMLDQVLNVFHIKPDFDLNIMKENQDLFDITSSVLLGLRSVFKKFKPEIILVHGDTTTAMAASLSGFYERIKIAHVEAGLRTNNLHSPWPEEANRQIIDILSDYMFAPTHIAKENLIKEGKDISKIFVTGNTVIDALMITIKDINKNKANKTMLKNNLARHGYYIKKNKRYVLITGHRRESFGTGFFNICNAIKELALKYTDVDFVYPVHLNTNVRKPVVEILSNIENIYLINPLDYREFVFLLQYAHLILTDSGGIQEEASSFGKTVLVMRDITERTEGLVYGNIKLVGTDINNIVNSVALALDSVPNHTLKESNIYGDGLASQRIIEVLLNDF